LFDLVETSAKCDKGIVEPCGSRWFTTAASDHVCCLGQAAKDSFQVLELMGLLAELSPPSETSEHSAIVIAAFE
jgi:hypothetical protein